MNMNDGNWGKRDREGSGHGEWMREWMTTRKTGVDERKQPTERVKAIVIEKGGKHRVFHL